MANILASCDISWLLLLAVDFEANVSETDSHENIVIAVAEALDNDEDLIRRRIEIIMEDEKELKSELETLKLRRENELKKLRDFGSSKAKAEEKPISTEQGFDTLGNETSKSREEQKEIIEINVKSLRIQVEGDSETHAEKEVCLRLPNESRKIGQGIGEGKSVDPVGRKENSMVNSQNEEREKVGNLEKLRKTRSQTKIYEEIRSSARSNWIDKEDKERQKVFEKRRVKKCFLCGSGQHLKANCPENKKTEPHTIRINHVCKDSEFEEAFKPHLGRALVNGKLTTTLRDTGSCYDVCSGKWVNPEQLNGKSVLVKQPLIKGVHCFPLADVEIEIKNVGVIRTQAVVADSDADLTYYILGNETQILIDKMKGNQSKMLNAVKTRNQAKVESKSETKTIPPALTGKKANARSSNVERGKVDLLLPSEQVDRLTNLAKISRGDCKAEQKNDRFLKKGKDKAKERKSHSEGGVYRKSYGHKGRGHSQLIEPLEYKEPSINEGTVRPRLKLLPRSVKDPLNAVADTSSRCNIFGKGKPREEKAFSSNKKMEDLPVSNVRLKRDEKSNHNPLVFRKNKKKGRKNLRLLKKDWSLQHFQYTCKHRSD